MVALGIVALCAVVGAAASVVVLVWAEQCLCLRVGGVGRVVAAVAAAVVCGIIGWRYDGQVTLPAMLWLACLGVALCVIDIVHHRLPDALVVALFGGGAVLVGVGVEGIGGLWRGVGAAGVVLVAGLLGLFAAGSGVGRGDVTFSAALALFLGARSWTAVVYGFLFGAVLLAVAAVSLLAVRGGGRNRRMAAGPSMFLGAVAAVVVLAP